MALRRSLDTRFQFNLWTKLYDGRINLQNVAIVSKYLKNPVEATLESTTKHVALVNLQDTNRNKSQSSQDIIPKPEGSVTFPERVKPIRQELLKRLPVEYHAVQQITFNDESMWYPIYTFPHIRLCTILIRFKLYLSFASASAFSYKVAESLLYTDLDTLKFTTLLPVISLTGLCVVGNYFRKLIVKVYTSEDLEYVRLTRFTFFGKRLDIVLPITSITPLSENNLSARNFLLKLRTKRPQEVDLSYDNYEFYDEIFKITLRYGGVLDRDRFQGVFGRILDKKV